MSILSPTQIEQYASQAGFGNTLVPGTNYTALEVITAIALAESGGNTQAVNTNDPYGGSYGILQINGAHLTDFYSTGTISKAAALNPSTAFQYAYMLSDHGTNFQPWGTYTSGLYEKYIESAKSTNLLSLPKDGWWLFNRIDNLGLPDTFGGFPKPDSNIHTPDNYPIANVLPGTVSGMAGGEDPWGASLTIKLDKPINNLADHIAYLHLADVSPQLRIGDHVGVGQIIGHAGANVAAGSQKVDLGFAFYHGSNYGHDGWQYETYQNVTGPLNPTSFLDALKSGNITAYGDFTSSAAGQSGFSQMLDNVGTVTGNIIRLKPDANVVAVLTAIDDVMTIFNPIPTSTQDQWNLPGGASIPSPFEWVQELFTNVGDDFAAIVLRLGFILLGAFLCFKVFAQVTDLAGKVQQITRVASVAGGFV